MIEVEEDEALLDEIDLEKPEELPEEMRQEHTTFIHQLDGQLNEKETLMAAIKHSQNQMQHELIDLMKNQYHSKVLELTNEIT